MIPGRNEDLTFGQIVPDSPEALEFGYSSALFDGDLHFAGGAIYIWRIHSREPGKGHLSALIQGMLDCGYTVKIPTPIKRMAQVVLRKGFTRTVERDPESQPYVVWVKEPGTPRAGRAVAAVLRPQRGETREFFDPAGDEAA